MGLKPWGGQLNRATGITKDAGTKKWERPAGQLNAQFLSLVQQGESQGWPLGEDLR